MGDIEHDGLQHDCGGKNNQDVKERIVLVTIINNPNNHYRNIQQTCILSVTGQVSTSLLTSRKSKFFCINTIFCNKIELKMSKLMVIC